MIDDLLKYDTDLFLFLNKLGSPTWDNFWLAVTNKWIFGSILGSVLLFLLYKKYGLKSMLLFMFVAALMITFTDQITNLFKYGLQRPRPCRDDAGLLEQMRFVATRCSRYGFFSGHSSNSMAVAIFGGLLLKPFYRKAIYILILVSLIVAYSRIYLGVHYPLDILCGLTFGVFSGYIFSVLAKYILKRYLTKS